MQYTTSTLLSPEGVSLLELLHSCCNLWFGARAVDVVQKRLLRRLDRSRRRSSLGLLCALQRIQGNVSLSCAPSDSAECRIVVSRVANRVCS